MALVAKDRLEHVRGDRERAGQISLLAALESRFSRGPIRSFLASGYIDGPARWDMGRDARREHVAYHRNSALEVLLLQRFRSNRELRLLAGKVRVLAGVHIVVDRALGSGP